MGVMRKYDLTNKKTTTKTNTKTMKMKMTNTFREHLQRAISETFDLWDIWSEWKKHDLTNKKTMRKTMKMANTFREHPPNRDFWRHFKYPQMAIQEKFWVWPYIIVMNSDPSRPNQIFTISAKFHNTGIPGVRTVSQFLRCFFPDLVNPIAPNLYYIVLKPEDVQLEVDKLNFGIKGKEI